MDPHPGPALPPGDDVWRGIEDSIRSVLLEVDATEAMEVHITARMRKHYEMLNRRLDAGPVDVPFPASLSFQQREAIIAAFEANMRRVIANVNELVNWTILHLLKLEVDLYRAQHEGQDLAS